MDFCFLDSLIYNEQGGVLPDDVRNAAIKDQIFTCSVRVENAGGQCLVLNSNMVA